MTSPQERTSAQAQSRAHQRPGDRAPGRWLNPKSVSDGQGELFPGYRQQGVFPNSPLTMLQAEKPHRAHAIVEQVIADLQGGPLAHLPSGQFASNGAWLVMAAITFKPHATTPQPIGH
jgi:hypothetical protein